MRGIERSPPSSLCHLLPHLWPLRLQLVRACMRRVTVLHLALGCLESVLGAGAPQWEPQTPLHKVVVKVCLQATNWQGRLQADRQRVECW